MDFLARVSEIRPDPILMDIQMPEMDGLETIRRLRGLPDPGLAATPAITALVMPGDREKCLEAGANETVGKPVCLKDLILMIQKNLMDAKHAGERSRGIHCRGPVRFRISSKGDRAVA